MTDLNYHRHLSAIAAEDVSYVLRKDTQYAGSWKRRGGVGAWFTIVRPMDRLVNFVESVRPAWSQYDIFDAISVEGLTGEDGTVLACVRDLRRYLLLVEAHVTEELRARGSQRSDAGADLFVAPSDGAIYASVSVGDYDVSAEIDRVVAAMDSGDDFYDKLATVLGTTRELAKKTAAAHAYGGPADVLARRSEALRPATPEDGGQHESLFPWVAGKVPAGCEEAWRDGPQRVLEPYIKPETFARLPAGVRQFYRPVWMAKMAVAGGLHVVGRDRAQETSGDLFSETPRYYWLDVSRAPPSERARWPTLTVEKNYYEWQGLGEWAGLYDWDEAASKFVLRDLHRAWAG